MFLWCDMWHFTKRSRETGAGRARWSQTAGASAPHSLPTKNFLPPLSEQGRSIAGRGGAATDDVGTSTGGSGDGGGDDGAAAASSFTGDYDITRSCHLLYLDLY